MRRTGAAFAAVLLLLWAEVVLASCSAGRESTNGSVMLSVIPDSVTATELTFSVRRGLFSRIWSYGSDYRIEKLTGDEWAPVPYLTDETKVFFTSEGYTVPPVLPVRVRLDFSWLYGELSPGQYRLEKRFICGRGDKLKSAVLRARFEVPEQSDGG